MATTPTKLSPALAALHKELAIPADYAASCGLPMYEEPAELASIGVDLEGRERFLDARVAPQWRAMCAAAARANFCLQVVSAFRSIDYQADLFRHKRARGQTTAEVLCVNAAPGFSEHHSGRALDLTAPGYAALAEAFEASPEFGWLTENAGEFGFAMTYPRDNPWGIDYEPWHWCARDAVELPS